MNTLQFLVIVAVLALIGIGVWYPKIKADRAETARNHALSVSQLKSAIELVHHDFIPRGIPPAQSDRLSSLDFCRRRYSTLLQLSTSQPIDSAASKAISGMANVYREAFEALSEEGDARGAEAPAQTKMKRASDGWLAAIEDMDSALFALERQR